MRVPSNVVSHNGFRKASVHSEEGEVRVRVQTGVLVASSRSFQPWQETSEVGCIQEQVDLCLPKPYAIDCMKGMTAIDRFGSDPKNTTNQPIVSIVKPALHQGTMVWGGITFYHRTPLVHIDSETLCIQVVEPVFLPLSQGRPNTVFQ
ncbi:hypothetical protein TNCV_3345911 [Trichonephila clavipes]|nr:hypothetical protein TNCV_3345911 [Trichonephila clavipes]